MDINSVDITNLLIQVEAERRRKLADAENGDDFNYIDTDGNVDKVRIYNNDIIEARRGCGKTSLILKALGNEESIAVKCDCQTMRSLSAENIVVSILKELFAETKKETHKLYTSKNGEYKKNTKGIKNSWRKVLDKDTKNLKNELEHIKGYFSYLESIEDRLLRIQNLPEKHTVTSTLSKTKEIESKKTSNRNGKLKAGIDGSISFQTDFASLASDISAETEIQFGMEETCTESTTSTSSKTIEREIIRVDEINKYKEIIIEMLKYNKEIHGKGTTIFLDDFYQINRQNHPYVLQYFHDIFKKTPMGFFCFKVVALPSSLKINNDNENIFTLKDDYSSIPLDFTLSELEKVQNHLVDTLVALDKSGKITRTDISSLFSNDDTLKYLVISTGGIPRDFMISFSEAIKLSRKNNKKKINKDQVYSVIRGMRDDKDINRETDSDLPKKSIDQAVNIISKEVVDKLQTSVILYPTELAEQHEQLLQNLVNLRYIHLIKEKIDAKKTGQSCKAYLIDMTFYATNRLNKDFDFCRFWERDVNRNLDNLRRAKIWNFSDEDYNDIVNAG